MFRLISVLAFLITIGWLVYSAQKKQGPGFSKWLNRLGNDIKQTTGKIKTKSISDILKAFVFPLTLICVLLLALTGFIPSVIFGQPLSGYLLIVHVAVAPVFAICIAILALIWANKNTFNTSDWKQFQSMLSKKKKTNKTGEFGKKLCFWLLVTVSIPVILSIVASMYKLYGTHGQEFLLQAHRYTTLTVAIVTMIYVYLFSYSNEKTGTVKEK